MIMKLYAVRDIAAGSFGQPLQFVNDDLAKREAHATVLRGDNDFARYPSSFEVYRLGEMDTDSGVISPLSIPVRVCLFSDFVKEA